MGHTGLELRAKTVGIDPNDATNAVPFPYNADNSGGSDPGPTSNALTERLEPDRKALEHAALRWQKSTRW